MLIIAIQGRNMFEQPLLIFAVVSFATVSCGDDKVHVPFVGCYSSSQAHSDSHVQEVDPLTWMVCVRLCFEKNVKYAGIEAQKSMCYCGNNLAHESEKVAPHLCDEECYADHSKTCGGDKLFSMYQLHTEIQPTFLVATDNGIAYFRDKSLAHNFVSLPRVATIKLAYHYAENQVYFIAHNKIWRTHYEALIMKYMPAVMVAELGSAPSGLALDWVRRKLYWTLPHKLVDSNLDGSNRREISYLNSPAKDLVIDPFERKMLFIQQGTIHLYDLKASKILETNILKFNRFEEVTCLTLDLQKRAVYAMGFYERQRKRDVDGYLVSTDYYGSTFRVLLRRRDLKGAFSLTALDGHVFWAETNEKKTKKALYSYSLPSENEGMREPKKLSNLPTNVQDVKLYDQQAQISEEKYFCEKKKCSHMCTLTSAHSAQCSCPENWTLSTDQRSCRENKVNSEETLSDEVSETFEIDLDDSDDESKEIPKKGKKNSKRRKHRKRSRYDNGSLSDG